MRTKLQTIAEQAAARAYGVSLEDVQKMVDNPDSDERLVGFVGMDWVALIMQIMQVIMDVMGDCQFGKGLLDAVHRPNMLAQVVLRFRVNRLFRKGNPAFSNVGQKIAEALQEEAKQLPDSMISDAMNEIQNPNRYMVI